MVGYDFGKLSLYIGGIGRLATEGHERSGGFFQFTTLNEVSGGLGQEEEAYTKNESP